MLDGGRTPFVFNAGGFLMSQFHHSLLLHLDAIIEGIFHELGGELVLAVIHIQIHLIAVLPDQIPLLMDGLKVTLTDSLHF